MKQPKINNNNWSNRNRLKHTTFWVRKAICVVVPFFAKMGNFIQTNGNGIAIYSQNATKPPIAN
ncbi:MAG: hypothetical protein IPN93_04130 [Bacteroidetes bacterium]|nr:hypothetical protein [Bacteroidota bacterium]MBK8672191.1 hypothetical protein [Bacteroidota bacterium]